MVEAAGCSIEHEEQKQGYGQCSMTIYAPYELITKSLLSAIHSICQYQTVNDLDMAFFRCRDVEEGGVFNISKNAQSIKLHKCSLPSETLNHLIQQINDCNTLRKISFHSTDLGLESSLILTNKIALTYLELKEAKMSVDMVKHVCQQITHLSQLEYINLAQISLEQIDLNLRNMTKLIRLNLSGSRMSRDGCIDIFKQLNSLLFLQDINISRNTLTGCLSSFLPDPHPGLPELEWLNLWSTSLNKEDLFHLLSIAHKLPKLQILDLSGHTLTGCLSSFLTDPHPGLPELKRLHLESTALNKDDLQHLFSIIQFNKLPKLTELHLSDITLTGCLSSFLTDPHPGLPELCQLELKHTALNKDDLQHITHITQSNKLPKLRELYLSGNTLTGCLSSFLPNTHPGLTELGFLRLDNTRLINKDLQHLSHILKKNKLPKLNYLELSGNTLTGCLSSFLPDPHPGLPELRWLYLKNTALNREDVRDLTSIMKTRKLPRLETIHLDRVLHNVQDDQRQLSNFLETCVDCHKTRLTISLKENNLPTEFRKEMVELCAGTLVHPIFEKSESTKEISTDTVKAADDVSSGRILFSSQTVFPSI